MKFVDYLNEVFKISYKGYDFGYNDEMNNRSFKGYGNKGYYTFFKVDELYYCCMMSTSGEIGFVTSDKPSLNLKSYKEKPLATKQVFKVLNIVISLISAMVKECNKTTSISEISFAGATSDLDSLYKKMIQNKNLLKLIKEQGYSFDRIETKFTPKAVSKKTFYIFKKD